MIATCFVHRCGAACTEFSPETATVGAQLPTGLLAVGGLREGSKSERTISVDGYGNAQGGGFVRDTRGKGKNRATLLVRGRIKTKPSGSR